MISERIHGKGILAKLLEQAIRILLIKECKKICNIKIDITSSSIQIIKGEIQKINIIAENINYKDLLIDGIELEVNQIKINFKLTNNLLNLENNPIVKLKILVSEQSLKTILISNNWNWIGNMISKALLNQIKLEDIKIKNGQFIIKKSKENNILDEGELININTEDGKIYLENKQNNKSIEIPIEDKIYIENINIENDSIIIFANSHISF
tara:strand:- start:288 stop:920 length:633 start_codon:yes stop_codon:yes gene_type:complete